MAEHQKAAAHVEGPSILKKYTLQMQVPTGVRRRSSATVRLSQSPTPYPTLAAEKRLACLAES